MSKYRFFLLCLNMLFLISGMVYAGGNMDKFEQGAIIYRKGSFPASWHGHAGVFCYFYMSGNTGKMKYIDYVGSLHSNHIQQMISTNLADIEGLKTKLINDFRDNKNYWGAFGKNLWADKLASIVSTADAMRNRGITYVWVDMLNTGLYMSGGKSLNQRITLLK